MSSVFPSLNFFKDGDPEDDKASMVVALVYFAIAIMSDIVPFFLVIDS